MLFKDVHPSKAPDAIPLIVILSGITRVSNEEQPSNDKLSIFFHITIKINIFQAFTINNRELFYGTWKLNAF
jgi:hypothetical protein